MLAGFLVLKLPVATMVNGSVSLAEQNGFPLRRCGEKVREVCKSTQEVQRLLRVPASPERTSPGTALPEGGTSLGNSS